MRFRHASTGSNQVELQMAPLIDVVFLLLIFFMLTLKVIPLEGQFNINMPRAAAQSQTSPELLIPDIKVRLMADESGDLSEIRLGQKTLGTSMRALNAQIFELIGGRPGTPLSRELEVEIDADYHLHYQHVMQAISACTGTVDPSTGRVIKYIEKIKFAPPRVPTGS